MVGDSLRDDVEGARALGMRAVLVDREDRYPHVPERLRDLSGLAGALGLSAARIDGARREPEPVHLRAVQVHEQQRVSVDDLDDLVADAHDRRSGPYSFEIASAGSLTRSPFAVRHRGSAEREVGVDAAAAELHADPLRGERGEGVVPGRRRAVVADAVPPAPAALDLRCGQAEREAAERLRPRRPRRAWEAAGAPAAAGAARAQARTSRTAAPARMRNRYHERIPFGACICAPSSTSRRRVPATSSAADRTRSSRSSIPHVELVDAYLATAAELQRTITAVLETHVQADHVSGLPALVAATGATAYLPARGHGGLPARGARRRRRAGCSATRSSAPSATPGHAPAHNAYVVADLRRGTDEPWLVFTGDSLARRGRRPARPPRLGRARRRRISRGCSTRRSRSCSSCRTQSSSIRATTRARSARAGSRDTRSRRSASSGGTTTRCRPRDVDAFVAPILRDQPDAPPDQAAIVAANRAGVG